MQWPQNALSSYYSTCCMHKCQPRTNLLSNNIASCGCPTNIGVQYIDDNINRLGTPHFKYTLNTWVEPLLNRNYNIKIQLY